MAYANLSKRHAEEQYRAILRIFKETQAEKLTDVTSELMTEFIEQLRAQRLAPRSINYYRDAIIAFLNHCVKQGKINQNPIAQFPRVKTTSRDNRRRRRAYTLEEFRAMVAVAPLRRKFAYLVAGLSGLRKSELLRLQVRDCDFTNPEQPLWRLRSEATKAQRDELLPMLPELAAILKPLVAGKLPNDPVVTHVPATSSMQPDFRKANIQRVNEANRKVDFHSFRYFFCTQIATKMHIAQVQKLMRHRDIKLTMNLYADLGLDQLQGVWTLPNILGPEPETDKPNNKTHEDGSV